MLHMCMRNNTRSQKATAPIPCWLRSKYRCLIFDCMSVAKASSSRYILQASPLITARRQGPLIQPKIASHAGTPRLSTGPEAPVPQRNPRCRGCGSLQTYHGNVMFDAAHDSCSRTAATHGEAPTGTCSCGVGNKRGAKDDNRQPIATPIDEAVFLQQPGIYFRRDHGTSDGHAQQSSVQTTITVPLWCGITNRQFVGCLIQPRHFSISCRSSSSAGSITAQHTAAPATALPPPHPPARSGGVVAVPGAVKQLQHLCSLGNSNCKNPSTHLTMRCSISQQLPATAPYRHPESVNGWPAGSAAALAATRVFKQQQQQQQQ